MTNPVVDLVATDDEPAAGAGGRSASSRSTPPRQGRPQQLGGRRIGRAGDPPGRRLRRPVARRAGAPARPHRPDRRLGGSTCPTRRRPPSPARRRLAFDELFRLQLTLVLRRRALERDARAIRHAVPPTRARPRRAEPAPLVQRFVAGLPVRADRRPAPGARPDLRRHGRPAADAPPPAGRRRLGQDRGRRRRHAGRGPGRPPGRADGAHRGARRPALHGASAPSLDGLAVPDPTRLGGDPARLGRSPHQPDDRPASGPGSRDGLRGGQSTSSSARMPC